MLLHLRSKLSNMISFNEDRDASSGCPPPPSYERYDPISMKDPVPDDIAITLADDTKDTTHLTSIQPIGPSWFTIGVYSSIAIGIICVFLFVLRGYVKYLLLSLEHTDLWVAFLVFSCLFTVVSFPLTWGYILLNIAAGYLYGLWYGTAVVILCALFGLTLSHALMRRLFVPCIRGQLTTESLTAILRVIDSGHGFKIVALARLTPIPFGLQNGLFAVSNISTPRYIMASVLGMFPSQGMHAYIGSTLRSMEEVISDSAGGGGGGNLTAYTVFIVQILMAIGLLTFVIRRARQELNKAVTECDLLPPYISCTETGAAISNTSSATTTTKRHSPSNSFGGEGNSGGNNGFVV